MSKSDTHYFTKSMPRKSEIVPLGKRLTDFPDAVNHTDEDGDAEFEVGHIAMEPIQEHYEFGRELGAG